jgi:hypothetical protein
MSNLGKSIHHIDFGTIDHAFVECPHCWDSRRVEWARKKNMMPPESVVCYRCKERTPWEGNGFLTYDEYYGISRPTLWEFDFENGEPEQHFRLQHGRVEQSGGEHSPDDQPDKADVLLGYDQYHGGNL